MSRRRFVYRCTRIWEIEPDPGAEVLQLEVLTRQFGAEGWELVAVVPSSGTDADTRMHYCYFQREILPDENWQG